MNRHHVQIAAFSTRKLLYGSWDVWHLHWPENHIKEAGPCATILATLKFLLQIKLARYKNTKIVWTAHNLHPHERNHPILERFFWRIFLPNIDGIVCLSERGRQQLFVEHSRARSIQTFIIPHGHYRGAYPDAMNRDEARAAMQIPSREFVLTFLGQIRAYKGVGALIRCFARTQVNNTRLLVVGRPLNNELLREITKAALTNPNVKIFPSFVDKNEIQKFLRATDIVVLPYNEILNSGSAILALSFDCPILVPSQGALRELREIVGAEWVRLYEGELRPETIRSAIEWTKGRRICPNARAPLDKLDWNFIAQTTLRAFLKIASPESSAPN
jgi:glycosyltransferase involved in cell wall biosynthesis